MRHQIALSLATHSLNEWINPETAVFCMVEFHGTKDFEVVSPDQRSTTCYQYLAPVHSFHPLALHYFAYKSRSHPKWRSCPFWHRTRPEPRRNYRRSRRFPGARGKSSHNLTSVDRVLFLHIFARRNEKARSLHLQICVLYACICGVYMCVYIYIFFLCLVTILYHLIHYIRGKLEKVIFRNGRAR